MATHSFIPVLGKRIRVTRLDNCGRFPDPGETDAFIATDGFVTVSLTSEVEDGTEILKRKADGSLCVNERSADSFKYFGLEMELCGVNPALLSMMTNAEAYQDGAGEDAGIVVAEGDIQKWFALEVWTGLHGSGGCGEGEDASGYVLLPFVVGGVLGDIEIGGEDAVTFTITGARTKGGNVWGVGPYDVVYDNSEPAEAAPLPTPLDPLDHLLLIDTALAPPPSADDPQEMPDDEEE